MYQDKEKFISDMWKKGIDNLDTFNSLSMLNYQFGRIAYIYKKDEEYLYAGTTVQNIFTYLSRHHKMGNIKKIFSKNIKIYFTDKLEEDLLIKLLRPKYNIIKTGFCSQTVKNYNKKQYDSLDLTFSKPVKTYECPWFFTPTINYLFVNKNHNIEKTEEILFMFQFLKYYNEKTNFKDGKFFIKFHIYQSYFNFPIIHNFPQIVKRNLYSSYFIDCFTHLNLLDIEKIKNGKNWHFNNYFINKPKLFRLYEYMGNINLHSAQRNFEYYQNINSYKSQLIYTNHVNYFPYMKILKQQY